LERAAREAKEAEEKVALEEELKRQDKEAAERNIFMVTKDPAAQ
jgi:hypothetical protein